MSFSIFQFSASLLLYWAAFEHEMVFLKDSVYRSHNVQYFYTMKAIKVGIKKVNHEMKQITLVAVRVHI